MVKTLPQYIISDLRSEGFLACLSTLICVAAANLEASEVLSHSRVSQRSRRQLLRSQKKGENDAVAWEQRLAGQVDTSRGAFVLGLKKSGCALSNPSVGKTHFISLALMSK